ncbi:MAG: hypothetical protein ACJAYN_003045, partial [Bermanella sp.]
NNAIKAEYDMSIMYRDNIELLIAKHKFYMYE